jgi:hypothetical protein
VAALAAAFLLALCPSKGRAQDGSDLGVQRAANAGASCNPTCNQATPRQPSTSTMDVDDRVQRWARNVRPLQDRLTADDRLRRTASVVGFGIAVYETSRGRPMLPLGVIGTGALRIGFSHQLTLIRHESGYTIEPSIGRGSVAVTFRKRLD